MKLLRAPASGRERAGGGQQVQEPLGRAEAAHPPQHRLAGVLERQVEVGRDARRGRDRLDQAGSRLGRLQVRRPHPHDAVDGGELRQQLLQRARVAQVLAVRGGVLADQHQLADAGLGQPLGLGEQLVGGTGDERAAERRDRAERAAPVAAARELQRGHRAGVEPVPQHRAQVRRGVLVDGRRGVPRHGDTRAAAGDRGQRQQFAPVARRVRGDRLAREHRVQPGGDVGVVVEAQHGLRLGEAVGQLTPVPLGHAAGRDHLGAGVGGGEQRLDRVVLGLLHEPAGVDEHDVGALAVGGHLPAVAVQPRGQLLRVDLVARAAQGQERDAPAGFGGS